MDQERDKQQQILQTVAKQIVNGLYRELPDDQRQLEVGQLCDTSLSNDDPELPYIVAQKFFYQKLGLPPHVLTMRKDTSRQYTQLVAGVDEMPEFSNDLIEAIGRQLLQEAKSYDPL